MTTEYLDIRPEFKSFDDEAGTAQFFASVFGNKDLGGDIVLPGAFADSLKETPTARIGFLADHEWDLDHRLGFVTGAKELPEGLLVDVKFNLDKQRAREIYSDFKMNPEAAEFSFGYSVNPGGYEMRKDGVRLLKSVQLHEVSAVLKGMNPATRLVGVKADDAGDESEILDASESLALERSIREKRLARAIVKDPRVTE